MLYDLYSKVKNDKGMVKEYLQASILIVVVLTSYTIGVSFVWNNVIRQLLPMVATLSPFRALLIGLLIEGFRILKE